MRIHFVALIMTVGMTTTGMAQSPVGSSSAPRQIGNRANGREYQPTPGVVVPREKASGIQPPAAQERSTSQDLERIDKNLMRGQGLSTDSVPKMNNSR